jgi:hypothetical protein
LASKGNHTVHGVGPLADRSKTGNYSTSVRAICKEGILHTREGCAQNTYQGNPEIQRQLRQQQRGCNQKLTRPR